MSVIRGAKKSVFFFGIEAAYISGFNNLYFISDIYNKSFFESVTFSVEFFKKFSYVFRL